MEGIHVEAGTLWELWDCPARWESKNVYGLRLPRTVVAQIGAAVRAGAEVFDGSQVSGGQLRVDEAAGAVVDAMRHPDAEVDWGRWGVGAAERVALSLHGAYCREIAPAQGYVAVGVSQPPLHLADIGLLLSGTAERVTFSEAGYGVALLAVGRRIVAADGAVITAGHAARAAVCELLAGRRLGVVFRAPARVIGLQCAKTEKARRTGVGLVRNGRALLLGDGASPGLLRLAADMLHAGRFYGNPASTSCNPRCCPIHRTCRWRR